MDIYLVRHAIAVPHGTSGFGESERPLTPTGIRKMRRGIRALRRLGIQFDQIWTSPLPRCRQTADLLAVDMGLKVEVRDVSDLLPGADSRLLFKELAALDEKTRIALVGHEPDLGQIATWLLTGLKNSCIRFKKGGVAYIQAEELDPPSGNRLLWLLTPRQMTRIARTKS